MAAEGQQPDPRSSGSRPMSRIPGSLSAGAAARPHWLTAQRAGGAVKLITPPAPSRAKGCRPCACAARATTFRPGVARSLSPGQRRSLPSAGTRLPGIGGIAAETAAAAAALGAPSHAAVPSAARSRQARPERRPVKIAALLVTSGQPNRAPPGDRRRSIGSHCLGPAEPSERPAGQVSTAAS